jgi:hypothetical protein
MIDEPHLAFERSREFVGLAFDHVAPSGPRLVHRRQKGGETRLTVSLDRRVVRARHERTSVGQEEHGHRPAALAAHQLCGRHVEGVDVGTLLAIDFDRYEVLVEQLGDSGVLERFVRHHVAPVTRGVPDGEEDGTIESSGLFERFATPGAPRHGVVHVV